MDTLRGWSPKTTLLLRQPSSSSSSAPADRCHHGGYDVVDHAFGRSFPRGVLEELRRGGWLADPTSGTEGRLAPARTRMDVDVGNLLLSFGKFVGDEVGGSALVPNAGADVGGARGDESAFISRQERMEGSFAQKYPLLHRLVTSIEDTARSRLGKQFTSDAGRGHKSKTHASYFEFDMSLTSVQIARYPGDGRAGYPRHCDRGATCVREPPNAQPAGETSTAERLLTFVYYITPDDWDAELDGGALRMFAPDEKSNIENGREGEGDAHFDVMPYADRLVAFRSDVVEHQVLPSRRRERIAVTVWLYGRVVSEVSDVEGESPNDAGVENELVGKVIENGGETGLPPPLALSTNATTEGKTIFVAIPSYRDEETWPTIKSMAETACHPKRVFVGVVFQVDTTSQEEVRRFTTMEGSGLSIESFGWHQKTNLRSMVLDCRNATGPCYARHLAQTLHRGEEYVLQIDSHMRFRPNWDEYLIQQMNNTDRPEKSVLTAYPLGYEPLNGPGPEAETRATILVPWKFGPEGMLRQKGRLINPDYERGSSNDNIPCLLYAGGFNFFHSSLLDVCPYDHTLHGLFFGEELSMAVRLYTHGYSLYAPPETVCYHLWKRNPLRRREDADGDRTRHREGSLEVVREQLRGSGRGLGRVRTAEQFGQALGVDFEKKVLAPGCENAGLGEDAFVSTTVLSSVTDEGGAKSCSNSINGEDMSSVLRLVGQYMASA